MNEMKLDQNLSIKELKETLCPAFCLANAIQLLCNMIRKNSVATLSDLSTFFLVSYLFVDFILVPEIFLRVSYLTFSLSEYVSFLPELKHMSLSYLFHCI